MKKIGLLFSFIVLLGSGLSAQMDKRELMEKIESRKVAYLSDKLDLSPEEAQVFWPIYNAYMDARKEFRPPHDRKGAFQEAADGNFDELLDNMIANEEKELAVKKDYAFKLKETIGAEKTLRFFKAEHAFKEEMLRELKNRREGRRGR